MTTLISGLGGVIVCSGTRSRFCSRTRPCPPLGDRSEDPRRDFAAAGRDRRGRQIAREPGIFRFFFTQLLGQVRSVAAINQPRPRPGAARRRRLPGPAGTNDVLGIPRSLPTIPGAIESERRKARAPNRTRQRSGRLHEKASALAGRWLVIHLDGPSTKIEIARPCSSRDDG